MSLFNRFRRRRGAKVFVLGLDCAAPELIFQRWKSDLPVLNSLAARGLWGELASSIPAITVPAWSSMLSGKDPGELGIYGFRNRADYSYEKMFIATGNYVREKRVWDYLSEADRESIVIGVPQTFPVRPLKGNLIAGFLTPTTDSNFTYPEALRSEVLSVAPEYDVDVRQFRTDDKDWLLRQIQEMTEKRFQVVDHLLATKPWDFFMLMEIGVDRIHHGFWSYHAPDHRRYVAGNPFENAIHDYYVRIDQKLGDWLGRIPEDTVVMVVSDHGAKTMQGGICVNEWLRKEGYLVLEEEPPEGELTRFDDLKVDWSRTKVWGSGGYYGRIFMNVAGREPQGTIPRQVYARFRDELAEKLAAIPDHEGNPLGTRVFKAEDIYRQVKNVAPDLLVYFGDLNWRSVGSLGHGGVHTFENDMGPDDCNHAQNGMAIYFDPQNLERGRELKGAQLMDVAGTILDRMDVEVPGDLQGRRLWERLGEY
jgi:predicted AlkP superfamily phosphohydrolase/phosphomutase